MGQHPLMLALWRPRLLKALEWAAAEIARRFRNAPRGGKIPSMLETLAALGQARTLDGGRYTA